MSETIRTNQDTVLNCLVIDDESIAIEGIVAHINKIDFLRVAHTCSSAIEAANVLRYEKIDLMFLDINMPYLSGLEFLESLHNPPLTIFSTAYSEHAVDGFRLNVVDYLLKPFSFQRFFQAAERALEQYNNNNLLQDKQEEMDDALFIKVDDTFKKIFWRDIIYIESMQNYLKLHFENELFVIHQTMTHMESVLPKNCFFRIHKSYLINTSKIESVFGDKVMVAGKTLPLSKYRKKELLNDIVLQRLISK